MSRTALTTLARNATRQLHLAPKASIPLRSSSSLLIRPLPTCAVGSSPQRSFKTSRTQHKGLSPETDNPQPKEAEPNSSSVSTSGPTELSAERYAELSDTYMDALVEKLEQLQEENEQIDVEYSVCLPSPL